ncbi:hypothetical protein BJY01DRAFT_250325 [Aspergillus pseudoustus]|uniref:Uncharacterized protein n=1 Tax=Aspergillus pseudoustus TaxID=1810923 RepID=A0ABR4JI56_9EURO
MDKGNQDGTKPGGKSVALGLAHYQAEWELIHQGTIRQIEKAREQEAREAELAKRQAQQQPRK